MAASCERSLTRQVKAEKLSRETAANRIKTAVQHVAETLAANSSRNSQYIGDIPSYHDPIEGGFYVQWYQLRQIQLGYRIPKELVPNQPGRSKAGSYSRLFGDLKLGLQLVDYGCGALAFPLGLTLFIAECLRSSIPVGQIRVEGFDYEAMLELGNDVWNELRESIRGHRMLRYLANATDLISPNLHPLTPASVTRHRLSGKKDDARWLSVIHVVYQSNLAHVKNNLSQIVTPKAPDLAIFTAPEAKIGSEGLGLVDPLHADGADQAGFYPSSQWSDAVRHITELRSRIAESFGLGPVHFGA